MDLKAILTATDDGRTAPDSRKEASAVPTSAPHTQRKLVQRVYSSNSAAPSPLPQSSVGNTIPAHVTASGQMPTTPLISPMPNTSAVASRAHSVTSMDGQADGDDVAKKQGRPRPFKGTSLESIILENLPISPTPSGQRSSVDINMVDVVRQSVRTNFDGTSLSTEGQQRLASLAAYVSENPAAYESYIQMIDILHQGFVDFVYPLSTPGSRNDPLKYDLLDELRSCRERMSKLFAVGESVWVAWLQDESLMARTTDERVRIVELCRQALSQERHSVQLWLIYGDWVAHCREWACEANTTDEEQLIGQEIFTIDMLLETWTDAVKDTSGDIAQSQRVWSRFIELRIQLLRTAPTENAIQECRKLFHTRLKQAHLDRDNTFQAFSQFVTTFMPSESYEHEMTSIRDASVSARLAIAEREEFETAITQAGAHQRSDEEYSAYVKYIDWEKTPNKRHKVDIDRCDMLYSRAELRFPSISSLWGEHVAFMVTNSRQPLELLANATRHCPWSGDLWTQYLLTSEIAGQAYQETEIIKHKATNTGILEAAGITEVLKVYSAWCSYLRRRACQPADIRDEDDIDIAEMGIRASIETLSSLGAKLGVGDAPDPSFRLERIYINFLSNIGRWDNARLEFERAAHRYGDKYMFWMRFYIWEMMRWRRFASRDDVEGEQDLTDASAPHLATAVLRQALEQPVLDYPEPLIDTYINHLEDYESDVELQSGLLFLREVQQRNDARRFEQAVPSLEAGADHDGSQNGVKRTHDEYSEDFEQVDDRAKISKRKLDHATTSPSEATVDKELKRDREHASVVVSGLPATIEELELRRHFSRYGTVKTINIMDPGQAIIEFDDAVAAEYALSADGQEFLGSIISVSPDSGSTVYVTNYVPEADEKYIRSILDSVGEIVSVRFPSLQGNKRRRFCYVQFKSAQQAREAVESFHGKTFENLPLTCLISNPAAKSARHEYDSNDGSTVFVGNLNFKATENDVRKAFDEFGPIILVRMPLHETMKSRNKGIAFVTFSSKQAAESAVALNGTEIEGRYIKVELATAKNSSGKKSVEANDHTREMRSTSVDTHRQSRTLPPPEPRIQRIVHLTGVPDTVPEAKVRKVGEAYGHVVRCALKTSHQGATLEYESSTEAGEAALHLNGYEIEEGRYLNVVSDAELQAQKREKKDPTTGLQLAAGIINRPKQSAAGSRKGGKLGQRNGLLHQSGVTFNQSKTEASLKEADKGVSKSNSDFRAMLKQEPARNGA